MKPGQQDEMPEHPPVFYYGEYVSLDTYNSWRTYALRLAQENARLLNVIQTIASEAESRLAALREEVIEECARVCETTPVHADMCMEARRNATKDCATNVRALNNADQA